MKKIIALILILWSFNTYSQDVDIVANQEIEDIEFTREAVTRIFTLDTNEYQGKRLVVFSFPKKSLEKKLFVYEILGLKEYQYDRKLRRKLYTGRLTPPIIVNDELKMIRAIRETPNSFGYVIDEDLLDSESDIIHIQILE